MCSASSARGGCGGGRTGWWADGAGGTATRRVSFSYCRLISIPVAVADETAAATTSAEAATTSAAVLHGCTGVPKAGPTRGSGCVDWEPPRSRLAALRGRGGGSCHRNSTASPSDGVHGRGGWRSASHSSMVGSGGCASTDWSLGKYFVIMGCAPIHVLWRFGRRPLSADTA
eukprot:1880369-Prymnesium_polylepis.1